MTPDEQIAVQTEVSTLRAERQTLLSVIDRLVDDHARYAEDGRRRREQTEAVLRERTREVNGARKEIERLRGALSFVGYLASGERPYRVIVDAASAALAEEPTR